MEIKELDGSCRGKKLTFRYKTEYYYEIQASETQDGFHFTLRRRAFPAPVEKSFTDTLLEPWLEEPPVFAETRIMQYNNMFDLENRIDEFFVVG